MPPRASRRSERIQGADPERLPPPADVSFCSLGGVVFILGGVIFILIYCLQLCVYLHPTLPISTHPLPIRPHSLFFPFPHPFPFSSMEASLHQLAACFLRPSSAVPCSPLAPPQPLLASCLRPSARTQLHSSARPASPGSLSQALGKQRVRY